MELHQLRQLLARPIAYHRVFARLAGGACPGIFLSQLWYWSDRLPADSGGWFYKDLPEWRDETLLTVRELNTARALLTQRGFLTEAKRGMPVQMFWRLNMKPLSAAIETMLAEPEKLPSEEDGAVSTYRKDCILRNVENGNDDTLHTFSTIRQKHKEAETTNIDHQTETTKKNIGGANLKVPKAGLKVKTAQPTPAAGPPVAATPPAAKAEARAAEKPHRPDLRAQIAQLETERGRATGEQRREISRKIANLRLALPVLMPWDSEQFEQAWADWEAHKRKKRSWYASNVTEQSKLDDLFARTHGDEALACCWVAHSIGEGWEGIYPKPVIQSSYTPAAAQAPKPTSQVHRRTDTMHAVAALDAADDND